MTESAVRVEVGVRRPFEGACVILGDFDGRNPHPGRCLVRRRKELQYGLEELRTAPNHGESSFLPSLNGSPPFEDFARGLASPASVPPPDRPHALHLLLPGITRGGVALRWPGIHSIRVGPG